LIAEVKYHVLSAVARLSPVSEGNPSYWLIPAESDVKEPKLIYYRIIDKLYLLKFNEHHDPYQYTYYLKSLFKDFTDEIYEKIFSPGTVSYKLADINKLIVSFNHPDDDQTQIKFSHPNNTILIKPYDDIGFLVIDDVLIKIIHHNFNKSRLKFIADVLSFLNNLKTFLSELSPLKYIPDISDIVSDLSNLPLLSLHYFEPNIKVRLDGSSDEIKFNNFSDPDKYQAFLQSELLLFKNDIHKIVRNSATIQQLYWLFVSHKFRLNAIRFSTRHDLAADGEPYYKNDFCLIDIEPSPVNHKAYKTALKLASPFFEVQMNTLLGILNFINVNMVVYRSALIEKASNPYYEPPIPPKKKITNSKKRFILPNSFKYKYYRSNLSAITDMYNSLIKSLKIPPDTELSDFRKILNNQVPDKKIIWLGYPTELKFLVDCMHLKLKVIEDLNNNIWKVTVNCFVDKKNTALDYKRFRNLKKPAKTNKILTAVNFLTVHTALVK
jgi:hypothetical protein